MSLPHVSGTRLPLHPSAPLTPSAFSLPRAPSPLRTRPRDSAASGSMDEAVSATAAVSRPRALDVAATHLVATLFYKSDAPSHAHPHADASPHSPRDFLPEASLNSLRDAVPTENMSDYPLEPPTPGPNPLDHLYGSYVSQSCLTDFSVTLTNIIPGLADETITSRKLEASHFCRVVEVKFPLPSAASVTLETLRRDEVVSRFEREWNVEVVFQLDTVYRRYKRLAVFDMDSTLIQQEVIDEIASLIGVKPQVADITAAAMNGELDFEASLRKRCALLKGVPSSVWETLKPRITLNEGVLALIKALKRLGFKTAVLSGGFTPMTGWMAQQLGLDYAFANHLVVSEDGQTLTGELTGDIVHAEKKRQHVFDIAAKEDIPLEQVLVVGDGANDLPMMRVAGLGVAFHAKPKVQMQAPARLNTKSMLDILYLFGISKEEQEKSMFSRSAFNFLKTARLVVQNATQPQLTAPIALFSSKMSALPVVVCGKNPAVAAAVKQSLLPGYEVIHIITSVNQGTTDIPLILTGNQPPDNADNQGTKNYINIPVAVLTGGGYDDQSFDTMKAACKDVKAVPWFRPDLSRVNEMPHFTQAEAFGKATAERCKVALKEVLEDGKGKAEGREGVWFY
ncbi:HAD-like domain-containing protein [Clohesyomyces aquaticus]|uniref:phosphoserine phosphatase n=1 Tax=Clohesyomyces aquaticus TaxID=1231657 RepID=A0A1Y1ZXH7_9PLEO|nr:HAD-like domain-containing protein [Clohesyomyces aquaticus]